MLKLDVNVRGATLSSEKYLGIIVVLVVVKFVPFLYGSDRLFHILGIGQEMIPFGYLYESFRFGCGLVDG